MISNTMTPEALGTSTNTPELNIVQFRSLRLKQDILIMTNLQKRPSYIGLKLSLLVQVRMLD